MAYYLTMDGGGSKLNALLYDDAFRVIARGRGGGVNTTQNDLSVSEKSVRDALSAIPADVTEIERVCAVFVGPTALLRSILAERFRIGSLEFLGECQAGLLAGAAKTSGYLALSGTGSDVFYISPDGQRTAVGGWGPILGDQGSGAWIGLQAVRSAVRDDQGWGEHTLLTRMIFEKFGVTARPFGLADIIYPDPSPYATIASCTRIVGEAARQGDHAALEILKEAGRKMALQMNVVLERTGDTGDHSIVLCGGAWKTHPAMIGAFTEAVRENHPGFTVQRPWFEHVLAGAVVHALERGMSPDEIHTLFNNRFPDEIWNRPA